VYTKAKSQNRIKHSNIVICWSRSNTLHWSTVRHLKEYSLVYSCPGSNPFFHIEWQKLIKVVSNKKWVRVTRFLVLHECFVDRCLSFGTFSFGHCVFCSSSIYGLWLPLWGSNPFFHIEWQKLIKVVSNKK
jgi:hypothetical protein